MRIPHLYLSFLYTIDILLFDLNLKLKFQKLKKYFWDLLFKQGTLN